MFFEILIAIAVGIVFGCFTGLIPGIHINLVSLGILSLTGYFAGVDAVYLAVFISAMAVTHTFIDIIPSVFLGAPDSDTALGVLPGHRLMMKGMAYQAVKLNVIGSFFSLILVLCLAPALIFLIPWIYEVMKQWIGWILIAIVAFMILKEKGFRGKVWGFLIFMMSGILGLIVFNIPKAEHGLFSMLTGLFGVSMLIVSISRKTRIPKQTNKEIKIEKKKIFRAIIIAVFSGAFVSFFPGLGSAQGAVIGSEIMRKIDDISFLILLGGINTANIVVSFITLYTISRARNGAVIAISQLINIDLNLMMIFLASALVAGAAAGIIALLISRAAAKMITKINYQLLCILVILFVVSVGFLLSGFLGLLILATATAIGIIPNILEIKRSHAMGCLLLPVILWFVL